MNSDTGESFAAKVVRMADISNAAKLALTQESDTLMSLRHPHVVQGYGVEYDEESQTLNILMELLPLGSLKTLVVEYGALPEGVVRDYTRQTLLGLQYLHMKGILHRDIKPGNILRDRTGKVKLADFGVAKANLSFETVTVAGTPAYMSPEAVDGKYSVGSDIWSVGCTILELLTGDPPWADREFQSPTQLLYHIGMSHEAPTIPTAASASLQDLLSIIFSIEPQERHDCGTLLNHAWFLEHDDSTPNSIPMTPPKDYVSMGYPSMNSTL
jgi:mitogen-activated protein kinase kinase kinase ANP1